MTVSAAVAGRDEVRRLSGVDLYSNGIQPVWIEIQNSGEAFLAELEKIKRWEIVDEIGPGTLLLRGAVLDIVSRVPPKTVGRTDVYLSNVGEATLVLELIDASDGEHVAVAAERRVIGSQPGGTIDAFSMPANRATVMSDIRRWARRHASKLRDELDKAAKRNQ